MLSVSLTFVAPRPRPPSNMTSPPPTDARRGPVEPAVREAQGDSGGAREHGSP